MGHLPPGSLAIALRQINEAGFFAPPLGEGLSMPDESRMVIYVRSGKKQRYMEHYGRSDNELWARIARVGQQDTPPRKEYVEFATMWDSVCAVLETMVPLGEVPFKDQRPMAPPKPRTATDDDGHPSICYPGSVPEYRQVTELVDGVPVVTVTAVAVIPYADYLRLEGKTGSVRRPEHHGEWLYFYRVDFSELRPGGDTVGVMRRYKTKIGLVRDPTPDPVAE
jgi:hypothetical protein